jgi:cohesin loading factor subunit SCC2
MLHSHLFPARLQSAAQKKQMAPADLRTLSILIFIISLLVEHCNFDRLRIEHSGTCLQTDEHRCMGV